MDRSSLMLLFTSATCKVGVKRTNPSTPTHPYPLLDHILSMLQNLNHYETLLARTHANYLAKISIELSKTSNLTNVVIGRLTIFATIIVPMNLVTGIWGKCRWGFYRVMIDDDCSLTSPIGMNVKVPGGVRNQPKMAYH